MRARTTQNHLYIPPMVKAEWLKSKEKKLFVVVEGELKALALARAASNDWTSDEFTFIPLGISGVYNFKTKTNVTKPNGEKVTASVGLSAFDQIEWKNAKVIICFDSDVSEKPQVAAARHQINQFFRTRKIKTFNLDFPQEFEGKPTKGIDDYLGAIASNSDTQTAIDALHGLLDEAQKPKPKKSPIAENFKLIEDGEAESAGVFFSDENGESFKVCSPLKIVAETQTETGENYGRFLEWNDSQNRSHRWAMPIEMVHSQGAELAKYLASNGLEIMPSRKHHEKLAFYIATSKPENVSISTDKTGWNGECFVLPSDTIGENEHGIIYQSEFDGHHNFKTSGSLKEWQDNISIYCKDNSRLLFAVSVAFAAPLLSITGTQGGGFHFRGSTSTGKTTASLVAGSTWGGDAEHGFVQTWKATANGLEIVAASHNHALLCLDEIGECEAREVGNVAYMLANGRGKTRMQKTLQARRSLSWNLLFISTGEQSLSDKIAEAGGTVKGGQNIRLCDISADTGKFGLFEDLHGFGGGQAFSDHLRAASCGFYGTPIRAFLTWLTETDFEDIREQWRGFKDHFISDALPEKDKAPSEVLRVAARFALVALGGELATEAGVTGWTQNEAYEAAKTVFLQWLNGREGNGQSDAENAVRQVRAFIEKNGASLFQNVETPNEKIVNRAGFVRKNEQTNENEYLILPETFRRDVCKGLNYQFVAKVLAERGYLEAGNSTTSKNTYLGKELGRKRVYILRDLTQEDEGEENKNV